MLRLFRRIFKIKTKFKTKPNHERYIFCHHHDSEGKGCEKIFKIINDNGNEYVQEHEPHCPERINRYIDKGIITSQKKIEYEVINYE